MSHLFNPFSVHLFAKVRVVPAEAGGSVSGMILSDQNRLYRETLPVERLDSGFGRLWKGAKVRFALLP